MAKEPLKQQETTGETAGEIRTLISDDREESLSLIFIVKCELWFPGGVFSSYLAFRNTF